jgi:hypothetical protein
MKTSTSNGLGVAHRDTPQGEVGFDTPAELVGGRLEVMVGLGTASLRSIACGSAPDGRRGLRSALSARRRLGPDPQWARPVPSNLTRRSKGGRSGSRSPCSSTPDLGHYPRGG